ncbi:MAG: N-acetylneuraminate synthase family protein [Spirochaetaceae bacterium]|jgi:sialic acid synthase SpsE|nr:N-acetylneuraminate synthase family protein [Spirochaetaceae bacterium]
MDFTVNGKNYNRKNVFIIAEAGTAHGGDAAKARKLIASAAEAGADCFKTQIVYADEIIHPLTGLVPLPGGEVPLYDVFKSLEVKDDFYARMKEDAESKGLLFLASPFGPRSAECLRRLSPELVKIASPELNYTQLLQTVGAWSLPVLLSTGVSELADIERALSFFCEGAVCLLHCVTAYPAPETDYNLKLIETLGAVFGVSTGLSDHSLDPCLVPLLAVACGACAVEKHLRVSGEGGTGLDDPVALDGAAFAKMCAAIRHAEKLDAAAIIAEVSEEYSEEKVRLVLGDGVKRPAPSEAKNYTRTNRSVHALRYIAAGEALGPENCAILRTEKVLRPGMPPFMLEKIMGRTARRPIPSGEGIRFEDV